MNFYKEQIVPLLINMAMRQRNLAAYRSRVVPAAEGRVIEIGIGSGLNLPFYSRNAEHIIGLDPSPKLLLMARRHPQPDASPVKLVEGSAEAIPFGNASADTVVTTWTLQFPMSSTRSPGYAGCSNPVGAFSLSNMAVLPSQRCAGGKTN